MDVDKITLISDNLKLAAELYIPGSGAEKYPAVCLCHGIPAAPHNPDDRGWALLAEQFCRAGLVTLIFNFRGAGLSEGNFEMTGWSRDLKVAINFLSSRPEVDRSKIYVLGSSAGAATGICVAAEDLRIAAVVSMASPARFNFIKRDQAADTIRYFRNLGIIKDDAFPDSVDDWLAGFNAVAAIQCIDKISPRPLLIMHGDKDTVVPVENAYQLYEKAGDFKELIIIGGAGHRLRLEGKAVDTALNWLKKQARLIPQA